MNTRNIRWNFSNPRYTRSKEHYGGVFEIKDFDYLKKYKLFKDLFLIYL